MNNTNLPFRTLADMSDIRGRRVLVRASLNVPLTTEGVRDDFRIAAACETIQYLVARGARVILLAHIGRDPEESLEPVYAALAERVVTRWAGGLLGEDVRAAAHALMDGEVLMLENVRSDPREVENDAGFARELAALGEYYVNDAFADSHRTHASIVALAGELPAYAGLLFEREYRELSRASTPEHPALFMLGGAKFETKLPLVSAYVERYEHVFIGGAIANDFLKAKGYPVGRSLVSDVDLVGSPLLSNPRILIPQDVVVAGPTGRSAKALEAVLPDESILDVGPETVAALAPVIAAAKTILWNGPVGNYENGYVEGTNALAELVAAASGTTIVGGGDTLAALEATGRIEKFDFVSTAGGAMLEFLEKGTLPGIESLRASGAR